MLIVAGGASVDSTPSPIVETDICVVDVFDMGNHPSCVRRR
jgi:hypothetical protein